MLNDRPLSKNPGLRLSVLLLALWIGAHVLFLGCRPDARMTGLPMIAWAQIAISALGVVLALIAIPWFDRWERR